MVYNRTLVYRTIFRKLPFGAVYHTAAGASAAPLIKTGRGASLLASSGTITTVADKSVAVTRVPKVWMSGPITA